RVRYYLCLVPTCFPSQTGYGYKVPLFLLNCKSVIADQDNKIPLAGAGLRAVIEGQAPASLTEPDIETEFRLIGHKGDLIAHERGLTTDEPCLTACESRLVDRRSVPRSGCRIRGHSFFRPQRSLPTDF